MKFPPDISAEIEILAKQIESDESLNNGYPPRWLAIQLLEGETGLLNDTDHSLLLEALEESKTKLEETYGQDLEIVIADCRYRFIHSLVEEAATNKEEEQATLSDRIDKIVTNRYLGVPLFLAAMYLLFNIVQNVSAPYVDWIDGLFSGPIARWVTALLNLLHAPSWVHSLFQDGILAAVGGVLVFLPSLFTMYFLLGVMEQSGYLSRAAFVMDRFMSKVGLHGKSFVPMILGFGCNVPAVYATRTIEKREARLLTGLLIPFMSCAARLPVYLIFGLAFFPDRANLVIFGLYLLGIFIAAVVALLLSRVLFQGKTLSILVMELPTYRAPSMKDVFKYARIQSREFIVKAGTLIMVFSMILWVLLTFPLDATDHRYSYYGQISAGISRVLEPAGFGTWEASGALLTGMVAKEMVVSTLAQVYHVQQDEDAMEDTTLIEDLKGLGAGLWEATVMTGQELLETLTPGITLFPSEEGNGYDTALGRALKNAFTPLSAIAYLVFVLLYIPCVSTVGAQRHEFGWRWAMLSVVITLVVPWVMAVTVYQVGSLLGG